MVCKEQSGFDWQQITERAYPPVGCEQRGLLQVHVTDHDNEDVQVEDPFAPEPESSDDEGMAEEDGSSQGEEQGESSDDEQ